MFWLYGKEGGLEMETAKKQRATKAGRARRKVARKPARKVARKRPSAKKAVSKRRPAARKRTETRHPIYMSGAAPPWIPAVSPNEAGLPKRGRSDIAAMRGPNEAAYTGPQPLIAHAPAIRSTPRCRSCGRTPIPDEWQCYECSRGD